jgi:hypothetical protein
MVPPTSQALKTHSVAPINGLNLNMSSPQRLQSPEGSSSILTKPQSPAEQPLATTAVAGLTHHQQPLTASQQQQQQQQQLMLLQALQMHGWPPAMCSAAASIPTSGNIDVQQHSQMIATAQQQPQLQLQQQQQQEALQEQQQQQHHHQLLMQNQSWMQHQQQQQARVRCLCSVGLPFYCTASAEVRYKR